MLTQLGTNIQVERKHSGLTQERLAEIIDVHPRIVQKIEAGALNPKSTTLLRIQSALGCPWGRMFTKIVAGSLP